MQKMGGRKEQAWVVQVAGRGCVRVGSDRGRGEGIPSVSGGGGGASVCHKRGEGRAGAPGGKGSKRACSLRQRGVQTVSVRQTKAADKA